MKKKKHVPQKHKCYNIFVVQSMSFSSLLIALISFLVFAQATDQKSFFSYHILTNILSISHYNYFVTILHTESYH